MPQFMSDSMRHNYGNQIADLCLFSICRCGSANHLWLHVRHRKSFGLRASSKTKQCQCQRFYLLSALLNTLSIDLPLSNGRRTLMGCSLSRHHGQHSWRTFRTSLCSIIKTETAKTIRLIHFMLFYRYRIHVVGLHDWALLPAGMVFSSLVVRLCSFVATINISYYGLSVPVARSH